ncbi:hypothetical protein GF380_02345 [Candidatus Uhrbacteria bacterium]|nr:hypothetical protein [Candidatus Uhrbacteria bacterium]
MATRGAIGAMRETAIGRITTVCDVLAKELDIEPPDLKSAHDRDTDLRAAKELTVLAEYLENISVQLLAEDEPEKEPVKTKRGAKK